MPWRYQPGRCASNFPAPRLDDRVGAVFRALSLRPRARGGDQGRALEMGDSTGPIPRLGRRRRSRQGTTGESQTDDPLPISGKVSAECCWNCRSHLHSSSHYFLSSSPACCRSPGRTPMAPSGRAGRCPPAKTENFRMRPHIAVRDWSATATPARCADREKGNAPRPFPPATFRQPTNHPS